MMARGYRGKNKSRAGFTLVEMVLVVSMVLIIGAVVHESTKYARERARFAVFVSDIRQIKIGATRFQFDVGFFPPDVNRGIDPGLVEKNGWQAGGHSSKWNQIDLRRWKGPYLEEWSTWKRNPWGGLYDWDNYEPGYNYMGITGGAVYVTLKPSTWGGFDGLPTGMYEDFLEEQGIDTSSWAGCVAVRIGRYEPTNETLGGGH